ncbi:MAG TPA: Maf family nucleotide pyrophosphatase [Pseudobdellovibrionaceae bacterium]|nr:Maf family nucleotide pyrophosphatase [Pseudobdellovibrionaceae bacterium]
MNERKLVLASQSPRRRLLMMAHGYEFTVLPLQISEIPDENLNLQRRIERLALDKVEACIRLRRQHGHSSDAVILTADTVVALDERVLGKPRSDDEAAGMLRALSGKAHQVLTAVAVHDEVMGETLCDHVITRVHFRDLNDQQIRAYVASGEGRDKAGSYGIQGLASEFVDHFEGDFDNVVGLPMQLVSRLLAMLAAKGNFAIPLRDSGIATKVKNIEERIARACQAAGRPRESVQWIGVSKTKPLIDVLEAERAGVMDFGENYAQEAVAKIDERQAIAHAMGWGEQRNSSTRPLPRWHFIGHLQSNKVKSVLGRFALIHSVDRLSLVDELQRQLDGRIDRQLGSKRAAAPVAPGAALHPTRQRAPSVAQDILVQVNYGDEETKSGLQLSAGVDAIVEFVRQAQQRSHIRVRGMMALPPLQTSTREARRQFADLRQIHAEVARRLPAELQTHFDTLSMGTTSDFESAVLEGATLLRIGTALFGERS